MLYIICLTPAVDIIHRNLNYTSVSQSHLFAFVSALLLCGCTKEISIMVKLSNCGKTTSIYQKDGIQYRIINRCNRWDCPICQKQKTSNLRESIEFYQEEYGLYNLLTLTTSSTSKDLDNRFKKILDHLSLCDENRFISKNKSDIAHYKTYLDNVIGNEAYYIWLLESKISSGNNKYIPRVHYALIFFDALKNNALVRYLQRYKGHIDTQKYQAIFVEKYSGYNQYIDLKNSTDNLSYVFYKDFEDLFRYIYNQQSKTAKNKLLAQARKRIKYNIRLIKKGCGIQYIRVLEYTQKNNIHYHILTNSYIPYYVLDRTATKDTLASSQVPFEQLQSTSKNDSSTNASNLVAYITKDIPATIEHSSEKKLFTTSQGISLSNRVKLVAKENSIQESVVDSSQGGSFLGYIPTIQYEDTALYRQRKNIYDQISNERKRLCYEFKQDYLSQHQLYFDSDDYKKSLAAHLNGILPTITTKVSHELSEFDNNVLVPAELERHKGSPAIISKYAYDDASLDDNQNEFIKVALTSTGNIALTGAAGTGKSKCISTLIEKIPSSKKVLCCGFTGKAVSHLREIIGNAPSNVTISTIHQVCASDWQQYTHFNHNEYNPLDFDICIIDEISMVDTLLFYCLANALRKDCKIIAVGDFCQLPPCDNSSIKPFVCNPAYFNAITLTKNYRSDDNINALAYDFLNPFHQEHFGDYDFDNALAYANAGYTILSNTKEICNTINSALTKDKRRYRIPGRNNFNYKKNQSIMFLKNDTKRGFYNGMIATITGYDRKSGVITINGTIQLTYRETNMIQPAYAMTIHKAQGSEFDNAVIILTNTTKLLSSAIAYTAISRVKHNISLMKQDGVNEKMLHPYNNAA